MTTTETGSTELLPCPFCGGAQSQLQINTYADMSWVACPSCGLEAPSETGVSAEAAVTYWNTRPLRNAQSEAVTVSDLLHNLRLVGEALANNPEHNAPPQFAHTISQAMAALTHPAPPLAVTDEQTIIDAYLRGTAWRDENPGEDNSPYRFKAARDYADKTLTAALEAKQ